MDIKKVTEEWEIWDKKEKTAKLEKEAKKNGIRMIPQVNQGFWEKSK